MPRVYEYMNYTIYNFRGHYKVLTPSGKHFAEVDTIAEAEKLIDEYLKAESKIV